MRKKLFAILLAFCMVLTMMPGMAWADTLAEPQEPQEQQEQQELWRLTLHGGGYCARPGEGNVGNGLFTMPMRVQYDGNEISGYIVTVAEDDGTIIENDDGSFRFVPKKAGTLPVSIKYNNKDYPFTFFVSENDLPRTRYLYNLQDEITMLLHDGRGLQDTLQGEKFNGYDWSYENFSISSITSDNEKVVEIKKINGSQYDVRAVGLGEATITITHDGFDDKPVEEKFKIYVVDKKWYVDWSVENDCDCVLPGSSVTFFANIQYCEYNKERDFVEDVDKPYILEWKLENQEQSNQVGLTPSKDQVTVNVASNAVYQDVMIRLDVYEADSSGNKVGVDSVESTTFVCRIEPEFYTIDLEGFHSNLKKGGTMTVTPSLWKHYVENGENKKEQVNGASFDFFRDNLGISGPGENGEFTITRTYGGDGGFEVQANIGECNVCCRWYELNFIEEEYEEEEPEHETYFLSEFSNGCLDLEENNLSYKDKYINMSLASKADENCFYLAIPAIPDNGKNYQVKAYQLINGNAKDSKEDGDTRDRDRRALRCEGDDLFQDNFSKETVGPASIGGTEYNVYKISLKKYLGHGDIRVIVEEVPENSENVQNEDSQMDSRVDLRFVLNATVKGDAEGVERLYNAADLQRNLFNFKSEYPDVELEDKDNVRTGVYYNAMDVYQEGGADGTAYMQGGLSEFALELKEGYVLNNISFLIDGKETAAPFRVRRQYDYAVYDDAGNMLKDFESNHFQDAGWEGSAGNYGGTVMSGPDEGLTKSQGFIMTMQNVLGENAGWTNQSQIGEFLQKQPYNGKQYSIKYLGALTTYLVFYEDYYNCEKSIEIVFDVKKLPKTTEVKVEDFDGKICLIPEDNQGGHKYVITSEVLQDYNLTGKDGLNEKLQKEYHEGYSVEKVFEITAQEDGQNVTNLGEYATISIPKSMFKGNPKHYKVMNVDDNGNMVEMETTYEVSGEYIVFKTGHLSKYAIVTNEATTPVDPAPSTPSAGGGFAPAPAPSTVDKAKTETEKTLTAAAEAGKYDEEEQKTVNAILEKAKADLKNAKTEEEVKAIEEAAQQEIEAVLTSEEKAEISAIENIGGNGADGRTPFTAKSKRTKLNGKQAIRLSWTVPEGMELDGFQIFRSTKKNGFGKKPYFTTTKTNYINTKGLKTGKTYYYKVKGFKEINGQTVYTGWSTKAYRTMK